MSLNRRQLLLAAAAATLSASGDDFWNSKPPSEWDAGDRYRLRNRSPWANPVEFLERGRNTGRWVKGVVTWESAQPLREATKLRLPWIFDGCYVIGVDGLPTGGRSATSLKYFAVLRSTGKVRWRVNAALAREWVSTSSVYLFGFRRSAAPIGPDSGDMIFELASMAYGLQTRFKPKTMLYRGQLAV